jgi:hypothetical protein
MYGQPQTLGAAAPASSTPSSTPDKQPEQAKEAETVPAPKSEQEPQIIPVAASDTGITEDTTPITKAELLTRGQVTWAPLFLGLLSGSAVTGLFVSHGLRLRKFLSRAKHYFVAHPLFDVSLVSIIVFCLEFSRTAGFIR